MRIRNWLAGADESGYKERTILIITGGALLHEYISSDVTIRAAMCGHTGMHDEPEEYVPGEHVAPTMDMKVVERMSADASHATVRDAILVRVEMRVEYEWPHLFL